MMARLVAMNISSDEAVCRNVFIVLIIFGRKIHLEKSVQLTYERLVSSEQTYQTIHILRRLEREVPRIAFDKTFTGCLVRIKVFLE